MTPTQSDLRGRSWTVPPNKHEGHTMTVEREDRISVDRWHVRCSCGEQMKVPGHVIVRLLDLAGEPPF